MEFELQTILVIAALSFVFILFLAFVGFIVDLCDCIARAEMAINRDDSIKISFDNFVKFYNLNPFRYTLCDDYVKCKGVGDISFDTKIDLFKYKRWVRQNAATYDEKKRAEKMSQYLSLVQKDIDEQMRIAKNEIESNDILSGM